MIDPILLDLVKVFIPAVATFGIGIALTPILTHYLYAHKAWKKRAGKIDFEGKETPIFNELHKNKEVNTPRMGGVVVWGSVLFFAFILAALGEFMPGSIFEKLNFLSRSQTWIPLSLLIAGSLIGLFDDLLEIRTSSGFSKGLSLKVRLAAVLGLALIAGYWFYGKLDVIAFGIPFGDPLVIGWLVIPLFAALSLFIYASGVIDGIDGLAGGVFAIIFGAYAGVAFFQNQIDLAAFAAALTGGILAFLWFNVPPARFYMSETGTMGLTAALAAVVFMTDALGEGHGLLTFAIIGLPLSATVLSNLIQVGSKKFFKRKVFRVAPLHHHFEAIGWPAYKVTMRYWIITAIAAIVGIAFALIG